MFTALNSLTCNRWEISFLVDSVYFIFSSCIMQAKLLCLLINFDYFVINSIFGCVIIVLPSTYAVYFIIVSKIKLNISADIGSPCLTPLFTKKTVYILDLHWTSLMVIFEVLLVFLVLTAALFLILVYVCKESKQTFWKSINTIYPC